MYALCKDVTTFTTNCNHFSLFWSDQVYCSLVLAFKELLKVEKHNKGARATLIYRAAHARGMKSDFIF